MVQFGRAQGILDISGRRDFAPVHVENDVALLDAAVGSYAEGTDSGYNDPSNGGVRKLRRGGQRKPELWQAVVSSLVEPACVRLGLDRVPSVTWALWISPLRRYVTVAFVPGCIAPMRLADHVRCGLACRRSR